MAPNQQTDRILRRSYFESPEAMTRNLFKEGFGTHWNTFELLESHPIGTVGAKRHFRNACIDGQSEVFSPFPGMYVTKQSIQVLNSKQLKDLVMDSSSKLHIGIILDGNVNLKLKGQTYRIHSGQCVIYRSSDAFPCKVDLCETDYLKVISLSFSPEYLDALALSVEVPVPHLFRSIELNRNAKAGEPIILQDPSIQLFAHSLKEAVIAPRFLHTYLSNKIAEFFCILSKFDEEFEKQDTCCPKKFSCIKRVSDVIEQLTLDCPQLPTPEDILKSLNVKRERLNRDFKEIYGTSFSDFYTKLKLDLAYNRLEGTNESITEIGYWAGYNYIANFSRAFQKQFGLSPREVRLRRAKT